MDVIKTSHFCINFVLNVSYCGTKTLKYNLDKWGNRIIMPPQQPAPKQTCGEEEGIREYREIQLMHWSLSAVCLHHTGPAGTLFSSLTSHFTPFSKPVLVRGGQQYCSKLRRVPLPFKQLLWWSCGKTSGQLCLVREHNGISKTVPVLRNG